MDLDAKYLYRNLEKRDICIKKNFVVLMDKFHKKLLANKLLSSEEKIVIAKKIHRRIFVVLHRSNSFRKKSQQKNTSSITAMYARAVSKIVDIPVIIEIKNSIDDIFQSITGMQHGKGMPGEDDIKNLKEWCSFGEGEDNKLDREFLSSITGMQAGKGMPSEADIKNLKKWCSFGEGDNKKLDREFLSSITGMQNGKGMPSKNDIKNLKNKWIENKDH